MDGLRCIACLSVFAVHFEQITNLDLQWGRFSLSRLMENGNSGVSFFFVLSGFLLSMPAWRSHFDEDKPFNHTRYWIRRSARIIPAYYLCLTGLIILQQRWEHSNAAKDILLHFLFLHNISEGSFYSLNPAFWTLAVEMQFYLILPLFFLVVKRVDISLSIPLFIGLGACCYGIHYIVMNSASGVMGMNGNVLSKSVLAHLPHFLLGISCGGIYLFLKNYGASTGSFKVNATINDLLIGVAFLISIYILSTPLYKQLNVPFGRYNYPFIPMLQALIIVAVPFSKFACCLLESFPLKILGLLSYGIYIYHYPILRLTERVMNVFKLNVHDCWFAVGISGFLMTFGVALFSYFCFERYFLGRTL